MKRYTYILLAALCTFSFSACESEVTAEDSGEKHFELAVSVPGLEVKSPVDGENAFNENVIRSVYYFFYPEGVDDQAPVVTGSFSGLDIKSEPVNYWNISVSMESVNRLFPTGHRNCRLFVVANPTPEMISKLRSNPDYNTLKNLQLVSDLNGVQDSFVMTFDGLAPITSYTAATVLQFKADLSRLASKITVTALVNKVHVDANYQDVRWESQADAMHVWFVNGMNVTNLSGNFDLISDDDADAHRFESDGLIFGSPVDEDANTLRTSTSLPLYSYPMKWDFEDVSEPYLLFELPVVNNNGQYKATYYKFMLNEKEMQSNKWYNITVKLNVLGSFYRNDPTQSFIRQTYSVLDWVDAYGNKELNEPDHNVDADIEESHYLVFNQTVYEIYDQEKLNIPFISSHDLKTDADGYVEASAVSVARKPDYRTSNTTNYIQYTGDKSKLFKVNGSVLTFNHELHNTIDASLDCTPWEFVVTVQHNGDARYQETITITQYPSIYIKTEHNTSGRNCENNLWVNGTTRGGTGNSGTNYGGAWRAGSTTGDSSSTDFTILSVSRFGEDSPNYIIGDPRKKIVDNLTPWDPANASAPGLQSQPLNAAQNGKLSDTNRNIQYYYPTDDTSPEINNYIAPKLRIASANGYLNNNYLTYENAKRRCASYQEDGYPAGRWRLPTEAEVRFIITLSGRFIPNMFSSGYGYWYANGYLTADVTPSFTATKTGTKFVRCVYDEWYWEVVDERIGINHDPASARRTTFYWGDMSREAVDALFNN